MKVRLKGDAICTLFLVIALCSLLYSQLEHLGLAGNKEQAHKKPSATQRIFPDPQAPGRYSQEEVIVARPRIIITKKAEVDDYSQTTTVFPLTYSTFDFKSYLLNKDKRNFKLLINQPKKCRRTPGGPFLLIAIKSVVEDFDRREIVRKTWGREGLVHGAQVQRVFLLGIPKNKSALATWETLIHQESQTYRDILLWDFMDTFFNLTLKEIHFLNWANEFCSNVNFIFKGDNDVFVNVENIIDFLERRDPTEDLFVGDIIYNAHPIRMRKSKYYIPETMYGLGMYPAYAGGGGFLLSSQTMKKLSEACKEVELFPIDDVFLGMCLQRINLKPVLHEGFKTFGIVKPSAAPHLQTFEPCFYKDLMVVHSLKVPEIWLMWNLLHSPRLSCTQKKQVKKPFQWKKKTKMITEAATS
ncbi:UDP-GlcNAc:betaGal beta-1,3-N-acetylglucosaminyltransferase 9 isoform X1 [Alligator sinensis]|uniref:Hexosyltransferase n=1 Tax=Alligator sinensis TaxID=38654 RepID=A0A3Q0G3H0_ALLSI|nr:UDP-GlcNAc:betaGal beta-1,3-N-acetylglucosaminyltransferase 9 isoform X1 [Alligator sinensis]XP_025054219.1 UDP-GlcNAc:betaGal beta-1,3-N-acetylglucosaminyltransferase 9 isoform X1 [Alligator sinensis]XP_025054220.1 UDP-GlcNAc:betaGal beta-1,3-N-acetylglucosaminyltransferase 9 isoform X1 [Alligator sinensis]